MAKNSLHPVISYPTLSLSIYIMTVPAKSNGAIVTHAKMVDCTPWKKVIRNHHGELSLAPYVNISFKLLIIVCSPFLHIKTSKQLGRTFTKRFVIAVDMVF